MNYSRLVKNVALTGGGLLAGTKGFQLLKDHQIKQGYKAPNRSDVEAHLRQRTGPVQFKDKMQKYDAKYQADGSLKKPKAPEKSASPQLQWYDRAYRWIKNNPGKTVGIAAGGVGLLGLIWLLSSNWNQLKDQWQQYRTIKRSF